MIQRQAFRNVSFRQTCNRLTALAFTFSLIFLSATRALADGPAPDPSTARFEVRFMEDMIDHHFMAVQMAQLCEPRAVHEELRELCRQIEATQAQEIEEMQLWLQDWYGISYEPHMTNGDMQQMERLASLSGAEFEMEFMKRMIRHHWQAIVEASQCVDRAFHEELHNLCENIILTQSAEIQQMRAWLCEWYDLCHYGPKGNVQP
jgi:uncharacterized protein (DUF305 family)